MHPHNLISIPLQICITIGLFVFFFTSCTLQCNKPTPLTFSFILSYVPAFSLSTHLTPLISSFRVRILLLYAPRVSLYAPHSHVCSFYHCTHKLTYALFFSISNFIVFLIKSHISIISFSKIIKIF